jgi:hypothetical protein
MAIGKLNFLKKFFLGFFNLHSFPLQGFNLCLIAATIEKHAKDRVKAAVTAESKARSALGKIITHYIRDYQ